MTVSLHLGLTPWLAPIGRRADELSRQAELADKLAIVRESQQPGVSQASISRKHNLGKNVLWTWRKSLGSFSLDPPAAGPDLPPPDVTNLHNRIAELERLLGQKAFEIEMLRGRLQGPGRAVLPPRPGTTDSDHGDNEWKPD